MQGRVRRSGENKSRESPVPLLDLDHGLDLWNVLQSINYACYPVPLASGLLTSTADIWLTLDLCTLLHLMWAGMPMGWPAAPEQA